MPSFKRSPSGLAVCAAIVAALLHGSQEAFAAQTFQRVSVASDGTQAIGPFTDNPAISPDGRFVAFESSASNLVAGDTNGRTDVFVHDRLTGITTRESVSSAGAQGNFESYAPSISADGRFVAFASTATNLIAGMTITEYQVYLRDRTLGVTSLVSVSSGGVPGNGSSLGKPSITGDGRFISFNSNASNLVAGDTNGLADVFTRDRVSGTITRDSVASDGTQAAGVSGSYDPSLSSDGRYVAFSAGANNLVPGTTELSAVFVHDRVTGVTTLESIDSGGVQRFGEFPSISGDGRFVAFRRGLTGLYLRDRQTGQTLGSTTFSFVATPRLSPDGRYLTFSRNSDSVSRATVSVYDRLTNQLTDLAPGIRPAVANNAVVFVSANALVADDTNGSADIYVFADPLVPGSPTALVASSSGSTVALTWSAPATGGAPTSYVVEAGSRSGLADLANFNTGNAATSFSAGGISAGTYYMRARASNANGTSAPSDEAVLFVGANCPGPGAPGNLSAAVFGSTVTLTWAAGSGATSYRLLVGSATGRSDLLGSDLGSSSTSLFATNVAAGTYFARVQSLNACGQSVPSNEAIVIVR
jgi:Tol biopolymer transport system component